MKKEKLIEILQKTDAPQFDTPNARAQLRRELLNSSHFRTRSIKAVLLSRGSLASAFLLGCIVLALFLPGLFSRPISAQALLANLESGYSASDISGKIHYMKTLLRSFGQHRAPIIEERWIYNDYAESRFVMTGQQHADTLGHIIVKNGVTWLSPNSRFVVDIDTDTLAESKKDPAISSQTSAEQNVRILTLPFHSTENPPQEQVQALVLTQPLDIHKFTRQVPLDMIRTLKQDTLLRYDALIRDKQTSKKLAILKRSASIPSFSIILDSKTGTKERVDDIVHILSETGFRNIDQAFLASHPLLQAADIDIVHPQIVIKIDTEENRVYQIIQSLRSGKEEIGRLELTFLAESFIDYDPAVLDERRFGLQRVEGAPQLP